MIRKLLLTFSLTVVATLGFRWPRSLPPVFPDTCGRGRRAKKEVLRGRTIHNCDTRSFPGTTYGTVTVADGRYTIPGMRVGRPYTVKISFVGYKEQVFENLTLNSVLLRTLDVKLVEEGTQLEEIVITSDRNDIFSADRTGAASSYGRGLINSVPTIGRTGQRHY